MKPHLFTRETKIYRPLEEVFGFFSNAENLDVLTPPELSFKITSKLPIKMAAGTIIDYKLKLNGIVFKWKTEITEWEKNKRFVDKQLKGPYKLWIHEHVFDALGDYTLMTDTVRFLSPGWFLEPLINSLYIERKVHFIFDYREKQLAKLFP